MMVFNYIGARRCDYKSGQIFPFMLAIMAVMLIMLMMTINLGQISVYKTDTANAADAGALAGASALSGTLLTLGLGSDTMAGEGLTVLAVAVPLIATLFGAIPGIVMIIAHLINSIFEFGQDMGAAGMAFAGIKKTAIQYALQNAGVDEPRMSLKRFIKRAYPSVNFDTLAADQLANYQQIQDYGYDVNAGDPNSNGAQKDIYNAGRAGFGLFMSDESRGGMGWWPFGNPEPSAISNIPNPLYVVYGWNNSHSLASSSDDMYGGYNSYDDHAIQGCGKDITTISKAEQIYDNVIAVTVDTPVILNLQLVGMPLVPDIIGVLGCLVDQLPDIFKIILKPIVDILEEVVGTIINDLLGSLLPSYPMGVQLADEDNLPNAYPISVTVTRYKKSSDLGIWNFAYGNVSNEVTSAARAGVYDDHKTGNLGCVSTKPSCCIKCENGHAQDTDIFSAFMCQLINDPSGLGNMFSSDRHLFESRIYATK